MPGIVLAKFASSRTGGPYAYTREAFGPAPAFIVMWSYWISIWTANAAIAIAATSYLSHVIPVINATPASAASITGGLVWLFTLINMQGSRCGCHTARHDGPEIDSAGRRLLLAAWLFGTGGARQPQLMPVPINGGAIAGAAALSLWSVIGFEAATLPARQDRRSRTDGPSRDRRRNARRGVVLVARLRGRLALASGRAGRGLPRAFRRRGPAAARRARGGAYRWFRRDQRAGRAQRLGTMFRGSPANPRQGRRLSGLVRRDRAQRRAGTRSVLVEPAGVAASADQLQPFADRALHLHGFDFRGDDTGPLSRVRRSRSQTSESEKARAWSRPWPVSA